MDPADLEKQVDRALRVLPPPRAPRTLLPRIMAAVEARLSTPWYARAWTTWPGPWQAVSVAALVLLVAGLGMLLPRADHAAELVRASVDIPVPSRVTTVVASTQAAWEAVRIVWRVVIDPLIGYVVVFLLVMSAACVVFGTVLNRVALGGASDL